MKTTQTKWPIYILSGGKSSRFGSDKAQFIIGDKPLIKHVYDAIEPIATSITIIANSPNKYKNLGLKTIPDIHKECGPISGIHTALTHTQEPWVFITSCDILGLDPNWAIDLWSHIKPTSQTLAFKTDKWEPLFAFYHKSSLPKLEQAIEQQSYTLWKLLESLNTTAVSHPTQWSNSIQVNRKCDLI